MVEIQPLLKKNQNQNSFTEACSVFTQDLHLLWLTSQCWWLLSNPKRMCKWIKIHCKVLNICKTLTDKTGYFTFVFKEQPSPLPNPCFIRVKWYWSTTCKTETMIREHNSVFWLIKFSTYIVKDTHLNKASWSICRYALSEEKKKNHIQKYFHH